MFNTAQKLAWVSMAPLGWPVVPPVYCSTAISSWEWAARVAGVSGVIGDQRGEIDFAPGALKSAPPQAQESCRRRRQEIRDTANDQRLEPGRALQSRKLRIEHRQTEREHHRRLGVGDLIFELARGRQGLKLTTRPPAISTAKNADHKMRRVRQVQSDVDTRPDAERLQSLCRAASQDRGVRER